MVKVELSEEGLVFRLCEHTPDVVRQVLLERGWAEYDESEENNEGEWNLWWRTQRFRKSEHAEVASWQRLNHFARTDAITRKDCLARNLRRMRCVHGTSVYDFHPPSYILPNEYTKFVSDYAKELQKNKKDTYWICKPTDLSRGRGIFVFKDLQDLNYDCPVIVQKYISSPLLISGYKFDLRIYVCVPSFQPLTIYIYQEGIVRFGTEKFDLGQLGNVFSHLTNTSINKYGPSYATDKERIGPGCKWTLSQLRHLFRQMDNVDETLLWQRITNIVILTLAAQAPTVPKSQNCFEVFGFDILIDQNLKPWLLEVNFSPALSMDCQVDFIAKRAMLNDLIDLLNFKTTDAERGGKMYQQCSSPTLRLEKSRRSRYGKPHSLYERVTTPKMGRHGLSSFRNNPKEKKRFAPRSTYSSKNSTSDQSRYNQSIPKVVKTLPNGSMEDDRCDFDIISTTPIPRNFSLTSMASSLSSGDSQDKSIPYEQLSISDLKELKLPEKTQNAWSIGMDTSRKKQLKHEREHQLLTSRSLPALHFQGSSGGNSTLPRIKTSRTAIAKVTSSRQRPSTTLLGSSETLDVDGRIGNSENCLSKQQPTVRAASRAQQVRRLGWLSSDLPQNSATESSHWTKKSSHASNNRRLLGKYKSPYSIRSTGVSSKSASSHPWPRTRVGDFVLAFPLNEAMREASGQNFDTKIIVREIQKIMKKLSSKDEKKDGKEKRRASAMITQSEAIELSFMLKFEDKDANPLYFWGPQHPPLLSSVLS